MDGDVRAGVTVLRGLALVLRPAPLLSVLAGAFVLALAFRTAPFGLPLALILLSWTAKHSVATLHALAGGARAIPVLSLEMIFGTLGGWRAFLVMLVLVGLLFATGAAAFWFGPLLAAVGAVVAVLVLPSALLALGWTNHVAAAASPRAWRVLARAAGAHFWVLTGACALVIAMTVGLVMSAQVHWIARIAAVNLGWLLLVALAGATIHARRNALEAVTQFHRGRGPAPAPSPEMAARQRQAEADEVYALWRAGAKSAAWLQIERQAAAAPSPEHALRQMHDRALQWEAPLLAARIAQELIRLDLAAGRSGYALKLARERLLFDPDFTLPDAALTLELAKLAVDFADWSTATTLLAGFERHTRDPALRRAADALRQRVKDRRC